MTMGVRVFYSEISGSKEVKKRQQRVMMILESKNIPFEPIDITEPGKEKEKDFMLANAKAKGDSKIILAPQIFNDDLYCGDYDDFDLANENDTLEEFLGSPKIENNVRAPSVEKTAATGMNGNAGSREPSAETEAKPSEVINNGTSAEKAASPGPEAEAESTEDTPAAEKPPEEQSESASGDAGEEKETTPAPKESSEVQGEEEDEADE